MIVTKNWLNDFIDLENISVDTIASTLNSIGLEVDSIRDIQVPKNIVVGLVKTCEKHPDADKLNVTTVDVGSEIVQIVCGAKNVKAGQHVPVAVVGADLGNNFIIKEAKLRGEQSNGMICSSSEIGLGEINNGILELDDSIGKLVLGQELSEYEIFNDTVIDIELTANRGDCLSIYGVARDLSSALKIPAKKLDFRYETNDVNIEEKLSVTKYEYEANTTFTYASTNSIKANVKQQIRMSLVEIYEKQNNIDTLVEYAFYTTGVLLRTYKPFKAIKLMQEGNKIETIYGDDNKISTPGIEICEKAKATDTNEEFILEASYIDPNLISQKTYKIKDLPKTKYFYNSSRGSEYDLEFGLNFFKSISHSTFTKNNLSFEVKKEKVEINFLSSDLNSLIGQDIDTKEVDEILTLLGFEVKIKNNNISLKAPLFRNDILNMQDVAEEIVRIRGIDNLISKPIIFAEQYIYNDNLNNYEKKKTYRNLASARFFENVSYFFANKNTLKKYSFDTLQDEQELTNPISAELDTLRSTLLTNLLEAASFNSKNGVSSIRLFELGKVTNSSRKETTKLSFIFSGNDRDASLVNGAKAVKINFLTFASYVSNVIGDFEVVPISTNSKLYNPYEFSNILINGEVVGIISSLHIDVCQENRLDATYVCEIDFDKLKYSRVIYKEIPKLVKVEKELSFIVSKNLRFKDIKKSLNNVLPSCVKNFYPVDIYTSKELGESISLSVKYEILDESKTLNDLELLEIQDLIINHLKSEFDINLR